MYLHYIYFCIKKIRKKTLSFTNGLNKYVKKLKQRKLQGLAYSVWREVLGIRGKASRVASSFNP